MGFYAEGSVGLKLLHLNAESQAYAETENEIQAAGKIDIVFNNSAQSLISTGAGDILNLQYP